MKILILGSVALSVPPPKQGGTERIAYWQAIGLANRGHAVTMVAANGSKKEPAYTLVEIGGGDTVAGSLTQFPVNSQQLTVNYTEGSRNLRKEAVYLAHVEQYILEHGKEFDVILNNMRAGESLFVPAAKAVGVPYTTVMHLPIFSELAEYFKETNTPVITISNAQRVGFDGLHYAGTVYNCIDPSLLVIPASEPESIRKKPWILNQVQDDKYLIILGSIAPHKNQKDAIDAARKLGMQIVIAGKIGDMAYYESEIKPYVDMRHVLVKGELGTTEKAELLAHATVLLFPVLWPEPFGLVMIEAMALGTPVVAYAHGAVPEVVRDGVTGFVVDRARGQGEKSRWKVSQIGVSGLIAAVERISSIDRAACRRHVESNFSMSVMIDSLEDALRAVMRTH